MTKNILYEGKILQDIHQEYLTLINFYHNVKRPSLIIKYFNINIPASFREEDLESTYDYYSTSYISFDVYENTPSQSTQTVSNRSTNIEDLIGVQLEGTSNIILYTIQRPRINDLVVFYYPIQSDEIFRVKDFNVSSNAIHSDPGVTWYELDLEYAPIENTVNLKINKRYIYDFSTEENVEYSIYVQKIKKYSELEDILLSLKNYYSERYDIYKFGNSIPIFVNEVYHFIKKSFDENYRRLFEKYKSPHGLFNIFDDYYFIDGNVITQDNNPFRVYNLETKEIESFNWDGSVFEENSLEELLNLGILLFEKAKEVDSITIEEN